MSAIEWHYQVVYTIADDVWHGAVVHCQRGITTADMPQIERALCRDLGLTQATVVAFGVLPGSHKELQRALKRAARDQDKAIEALAAAERKAKEAEPDDGDQPEAEVANVEDDG